MLEHWDFDGSRDGFVYADDTFRSTDQPYYARGNFVGSGGHTNGGLKVTLGGRDGADIEGMSGGWSKQITLDETQDVTLTFRFRLVQSKSYESDEYTDALFALDGKLIGTGGKNYLARISDGDKSKGWQKVTIDLGELSAGKHTLTFGGYNNKKTTKSETSKVIFDDIVFEGEPVSDPNPPSDPPGSGGIDLEAFEAEVFELTNAYRVANGRDPLSNDTRLNAAAEDWSIEMARGDFFRHSSPDQVEQEGYDWRSWGENIAAGYQTPEDVVNGWINSPGHRANMLSDNYEDIGIGHFYLANDTGGVNYNHYWTQVFGTEAGVA